MPAATLAPRPANVCARLTSGANGLLKSRPLLSSLLAARERFALEGDSEAVSWVAESDLERAPKPGEDGGVLLAGGRLAAMVLSAAGGGVLMVLLMDGCGCARSSETLGSCCLPFRLARLLWRRTLSTSIFGLAVAALLDALRS